MRLWKMISLTAALAVGAALSATASVSAMPLGAAAGGSELALHLKTTSPLIKARHRRGRTIGAGVAAGILLGGAVAAHPSYYYRGYPPYPYYTPAYPAYGPYSPGDPAVAYCMRRFRSYDPHTMTYIGYDGNRHPCP
jgi:hypothetical protein